MFVSLQPETPTDNPMKRTIKIMALLMLFAAPVLLGACSEKENGGGPVTIVGNWLCNSYVENGTTYPANDLWEFRNNGVVTIEVGSIVSTGTYVLAGDALTLTFGENVVDYTINSLEKSSMQLTQNYSGSIYNYVRQ